MINLVNFEIRSSTLLVRANLENGFTIGSKTRWTIGSGLDQVDNGKRSSRSKELADRAMEGNVQRNEYLKSDSSKRNLQMDSNGGC